MNSPYLRLNPYAPLSADLPSRGLLALSLLVTLLTSPNRAFAACTLLEALDAESSHIEVVGYPGTLEWGCNTTQTHDGVDAAGGIAGQKMAVMGLQLEGPGAIEFYYRSAAAGDGFRAFIGETPDGSVGDWVVGGGQTEWRKFSALLRSGRQTLWFVNESPSVLVTVDEFRFIPLPHVFSFLDQPFGRTHGEWEAAYWKWQLEIPAGSGHPSEDATGAFAHKNQSDPVFFLAGNTKSPTVARKFTISSDKPIFIPITTVECSTIEPPPFHGTDFDELRQCTQQYYHGDLALTIDGYSFPTDWDLPYRWASSPLFSFVLPARNILSIPRGGPAEAVAYGAHVIIGPMSPGEHHIQYRDREALYDYQITATNAPNPPRIAIEPFGFSGPRFTSSFLSTFAFGSEPLTYSWARNGVPIKGADSKVLKILKLDSGNQGDYTCVVSNLYGSATSRVATVKLVIKPSIVTQPVSRTNLIGTTATFTIEVTNSTSLPMYCVWSRGDEVIEVQDSVNSHTSTLVIRDIHPSDSGAYRVQASNLAGSVASRVADLKVVSTTSPPSVSLVSPSDHSIAYENSQIRLDAIASDSDEGVARVEFYAEDVLLGVDYSGPPYSFTWSAPGLGEYALTAKAYDLVEATTTSQPIRIVVTPPEDTPLRITEFSLADGAVTLGFTVGAGRVYQLETSPSVLGPWEPTGDSGVGDGALWRITHPAVSTANRFFRLKLE